MNNFNDWNFVGLIGNAADILPYELLEAMALDAAMAAVNERRPALGDGEADRVMDAAAAAAQAILQLTQTPNDWRGFLNRIPRNRLPQLRHQVAGIVYESIPNKPGPLNRRRREALEQIRALVPQEHQKTLTGLIFDYECADWDGLIEDTNAAFSLGYALGRDPSAFFFEGAADGE